MTTRLKALAPALLAVTMWVSHCPSWAQAVTVYTTTFLPPIQLDDHAADVIWLDRPEQLLQGLSRHASQAAGQIPQVIVQRVIAAAGEGFFGDFSHQVNGLVAAWRHGIETLPAIVVADRYVLYGLYSVAEARRRVDAYQREFGQ